MIPAVNSSRLPTRCKSSSANSCTASHKQAVTNNLKALKVQANLSRERDQIKDKEPTSNVSISNIFSEKGRTRILPADAHKGSLTSSTQRGNYLKKEAINVEEVLLKENKILKETSDKFLEHMKVCKLELIVRVYSKLSLYVWTLESQILIKAVRQNEYKTMSFKNILRPYILLILSFC
jgi:membrane-associated HD superfamily phosphohydrolase